MKTGEVKQNLERPHSSSDQPILLRQPCSCSPTQPANPNLRLIIQMRACLLAKVNIDYGSCAQRLILGTRSRNPPFSFTVLAAQSRFSEPQFLSKRGRTFTTELKKTCATQRYSNCSIQTPRPLLVQGRSAMAASASFHLVPGDLNARRGSCRSALSIARRAAVSYATVHSFRQARMSLPARLASGLSNMFSGSSLKSSLALSFQCYSNGGAPDVPLTDEQHEVPSDVTPQKKSDQAKLRLNSGSFYLPHPDKVKTGGEDAHFICENGCVIGVADGVGGWADVGIDAGEYARQLMSNSVSSLKNESKASLDPLKVLEKAYQATKAQGSSTACIVALTEEGIRAINVGDSGFVVIRDGSTVFHSPPQQYGFNFPYQLGNDTGADVPSSGQVFKFPVIAGDVIVAGTDGLFDNLYPNEISAVVVNAMRVHLDPKITAQNIATRAQERAMDQSKQTPFSTAAQGAGYRFYGGKLDDITVVVSYVTNETNLNSSQ
ncbi:hypothetical protein V2J09_016614 [Rumex salicifolius]